VLSTALAPDEILAAIELPLLPACPQTPTIAAAGVAGFALTGWCAMFGATGLAPALAALRHALAKPGVVRRLEALGSPPVGSAPGAFVPFSWPRASGSARSSAARGSASAEQLRAGHSTRRQARDVVRALARAGEPQALAHAADAAERLAQRAEAEGLFGDEAVPHEAAHQRPSRRRRR
jgi:hypothetical protein